MSGLTGAMSSAANALRVFEKALTVVQNNVTNASTPGYAKQRLGLVSDAFHPDSGLTGGVSSTELDSARDGFSELAVRLQTQIAGESRQRAAELSRVEPLFDVSGKSGLGGALNRLFQSFSSWSVDPNNPVSRQVVIDAAADVAQGSNETAEGLTSAAQASGSQVTSAVDRINSLVGRLRDLNSQQRQSYASRTDPSFDAMLNSTLEELSALGDFTVLQQQDGSVSVLLGGQTPLVIADRQYTITADLLADRAVILDSAGSDITAQISGGQLSASLEMRNKTIPSYMSELNRLASGLAETVNGILTTGLDGHGNPGLPLFAYNTADDAAASIQVISITPQELAGADSGAPGGNGNTLKLAALATAPQPALGGSTIMGAYGMLAQRVGRDVATATDDQDTQNELLLQTKSMRAEISSVSLDEEAAHLIEYQRAYQACARLISVLDSLSEETINLLG